MTDINDIAVKVEEKVSSLLSSEGFELFAINIKRRSGTLSLEILVDKPRGGISIDECSSINKEILGIDDIIETIGEEFSLEVSSPGVDRPLENEKDFNRVLDSEVDIYLCDKIDDKLQHGGKLIAVNNKEIVLETKSGNVNIPITKINKALPRI